MTWMDGSLGRMTLNSCGVGLLDSLSNVVLGWFLVWAERGNRLHI